ncbi:head completion/stabilization protein [Govanella unica]|uniref:Head completion/stabilization protein n=1 Tax=Govanella unica TaxID=2975056 RepID=A0A9X3TW42_9PROT|nr:head completion/stabilization protein [Govania unica]MDA5192809.1 head completion/stabilization protein [Govania unica]
MSFVARPPMPVAPETNSADEPIINDGFFPDVNPLTVRTVGRISTAVPPERLRAAIIAAIMTVERDLTEWANLQRAAGYTSLADVPGVVIDGLSRLLQLYQRAVTLYAKAELIERTRDFDTTAAGGKAVDELTESVGDLRRDAAHAVRDMLGRSRTIVELI